MTRQVHPPRTPVATLGLWVMLGLAPALPASADDTAKGITPVHDVRTMGDEQMRAMPSVRLRGVVLHRYVEDNAFILQDATDAVFVILPRHAARTQPGNPQLNIAVGSLVEVTGTATVGDFAPILVIHDPADVQVMGMAPLPAPQPLTAEAAQTGRLDAHSVVAEGVVRKVLANPNSHQPQFLEMVFEGTRLIVEINPDAADWDALVDARIRITGISSGVWNNQRQITAPYLAANLSRDITVLREAPADPFALPLRSVADIMRYRPLDAPGHRIHIAGTVLHALADGRVFVVDGENTVCVQAAGSDSLQMGDACDVVGFPGMKERAPFLEDARLRVRSHHAPLPAASPREAATVLQLGTDYELVQMTATLMETHRTPGGTDLLLQSGDYLFKASFSGPDAAGISPPLQPGSRLSVAGLLLFSFPSPSIHKFQPSGFSLLLRSSADVRVIRKPPWWTSTRLFGTLGIFSALVLVLTLWNYFLRARTKAQQEIINTKTRREATSEERTRLARELHDTLEQEFVGMSRQTEALEHSGPLTPQATANLEVLRQMLQLSRDNARHAVWDLRDPVMLHDGLESAMRNTLPRIVHSKPVELRIQVSIDPATGIPPQIQVNVLRLAQEAVTNAVKHSGARTIEVHLTCQDGTLDLSVADDGHGDETGGTPPLPAAGHFGIIGMRERCEKFGGHFEFHTRPAGGARVHATLPI